MDGCLVTATCGGCDGRGRACLCAQISRIHPVYPSVVEHFVQMSFQAHLPFSRWGKDSLKEEVLKQSGNGSDRGRCSKPFGSIKARCLTQSGVGREGFLEEGPLELSLEE